MRGGYLDREIILHSAGRFGLRIRRRRYSVRLVGKSFGDFAILLRDDRHIQCKESDLMMLGMIYRLFTAELFEILSISDERTGGSIFARLCCKQIRESDRAGS